MHRFTALVVFAAALSTAAPAWAGDHGKDHAQPKAKHHQKHQPPAARRGEHAFAVRPTKFRPEQFPVTVQFRDFHTKQVVAEVHYAAPGDTPSAAIPEGVPHALFVRTSGHDFLEYWGYWVVEPGAARELLLPFGQ